MFLKKVFILLFIFIFSYFAKAKSLHPNSYWVINDAIGSMTHATLLFNQKGIVSKGELDFSQYWSFSKSDHGVLTYRGLKKLGDFTLSPKDSQIQITPTSGGAVRELVAKESIMVMRDGQLSPDFRYKILTFSETGNLVLYTECIQNAPPCQVVNKRVCDKILELTGEKNFLVLQDKIRFCQSKSIQDGLDVARNIGNVDRQKSQSVLRAFDSSIKSETLSAMFPPPSETEEVKGKSSEASQLLELAYICSHYSREFVDPYSSTAESSPLTERRSSPRGHRAPVVQ